MYPDIAFRKREIGRVLAVCPNFEQCGFKGKVEDAVVSFVMGNTCTCHVVITHEEIVILR